MANGDFFEFDRLLKPTQVSRQLCLFPQERDDILAKARISLDELARWRELGWLSAEAATLFTLETFEIAELIFIRNIARSGLSDSLINELLGELEKPYGYDPSTTAYSFAHGWVQINIPDMDDVMQTQFETWVQGKVAINDLDTVENIWGSVGLALAHIRVALKKKTGKVE